MIPVQFVLFWAGGGLPYLRYLTFKSLRHFHPKAKIQLYLSKNFKKDIHNWSSESQDFESTYTGKDYLEELAFLNIEIVRVDHIGNPELCPIFQSDIFRFIWLRDNGGYYADTDQLFLRSFDSLPADSEFIYSSYIESQCGLYYPVGLLGLEKDSEIARIALVVAVKIYNPNNYNSSGPCMLKAASKFMNLSRSFNAPSQYFYPVNSSSAVNTIYNGTAIIPKEAYAIHWFGGHPLSQKFVSQYTEEFAKVSNDTISILARKNGII